MHFQLLNVDYKIASKAIAQRIEPTLTKLLFRIYGSQNVRQQEAMLTPPWPEHV